MTLIFIFGAITVTALERCHWMQEMLMKRKNFINFRAAPVTDTEPEPEPELELEPVL